MFSRIQVNQSRGIEGGDDPDQRISRDDDMQKTVFVKWRGSFHHQEGGCSRPTKQARQVDRSWAKPQGTGAAEALFGRKLSLYRQMRLNLKLLPDSFPHFNR
jgi:hypothetical protein